MGSGRIRMRRIPDASGGGTSAVQVDNEVLYEGLTPPPTMLDGLPEWSGDRFLGFFALDFWDFGTLSTHLTM